MGEKQLITKLERERTDLLAKQATVAARLATVDQALAGLYALTGKTPPAPPRRPRPHATGTKAHILDALADGQRRGVREIAEAIKVKVPATGWHLKELVRAGDVVREGRSHPGPMVVWFVRDTYNPRTCLALVTNQGTGQVYGPTAVDPTSCDYPR